PQAKVVGQDTRRATRVDPVPAGARGACGGPACRARAFRANHNRRSDRGARSRAGATSRNSPGLVDFTRLVPVFPPAPARAALAPGTIRVEECVNAVRLGLRVVLERPGD